MTDDPHDAIPEWFASFLWSLTRLERCTDPIVRRAIKISMNQQYGRGWQIFPIDSWPL